MSVKASIALALLGLTAVRPAQGADLRISLGVRETGTAVAIGADGGTTGTIEWIRQDGLPLPIDGQFHSFSFNFGTDPVTAFTGNGVLNGTRGTLEHIRIRNIDGVAVPIYLYIDNIRNMLPAGAQTVSDFEGFASGVEVTFQEPSFSSSTVTNLLGPPDRSLTTTATSSQGAVSDEVQFRFIDNSPTRWLRLTTANTPNLPNPAIDFAAGNSLSFDLKAIAIPEPSAAILLVAGITWLRSRKRRGA